MRVSRMPPDATGRIVYSKAVIKASKRVRRDLSCGVTGGAGSSIDNSE